MACRLIQAVSGKLAQAHAVSGESVSTLDVFGAVAKSLVNIKLQLAIACFGDNSMHQVAPPVLQHNTHRANGIANAVLCRVTLELLKWRHHCMIGGGDLYKGWLAKQDRCPEVPAVAPAQLQER